MPFIFRGCQGWFQHLKERRIKTICISLPLAPAGSLCSLLSPSLSAHLAGSWAWVSGKACQRKIFQGALGTGRGGGCPSQKQGRLCDYGGGRGQGGGLGARVWSSGALGGRWIEVGARLDQSYGMEDSGGRLQGSPRSSPQEPFPPSLPQLWGGASVLPGFHSGSLACWNCTGS